MRVKFGVLEHTQGLHLHAQFHMNVFIVSASGSEKRQFGANFDISGASLLYRPLLPMTAKFSALEQTHSLRLHAKLCLDRFILSLSGGEKKTIFAVFWTSAFSDVAIWRQSEKVEHRCTTASKSFLYSNAFMAKSGAQTLTFKSVRDKQTKNSTFLATPTAGEIRTPPNLSW